GCSHRVGRGTAHESGRGFLEGEFVEHVGAREEVGGGLGVDFLPLGGVPDLQVVDVAVNDNGAVEAGKGAKVGRDRHAALGVGGGVGGVGGPRPDQLSGLVAGALAAHGGRAALELVGGPD